ncbi:MAG: hypothetical protein HY040_02460 [Planctomycetes bacterium]|nr:hypothetical protein [Planctomycetota bacterium]
MGHGGHIEPHHAGTKQILAALTSFGQQLSSISTIVLDLHQTLHKTPGLKEWYSTSEMAAAMGVSVYTVSVRWCNTNRIDCKKDPHSGKWRIPGHEYQRLIKGGSLKPRQTNV